MARVTTRPDTILDSKRPSGALPNPARPDLGQVSRRVRRIYLSRAKAAFTGCRPKGFRRGNSSAEAILKACSLLDAQLGR